MSDEKHPGGRPPRFETPDQLKAACDEYVASNPGKMTITGLAMWLGFCDRQSLYDYEKKPKFTCTIKEARLAVENDYELSLRSASVTGAIFALKNMGWSDKQQIEHSGELGITWNETKTYGPKDFKDEVDYGNDHKLPSQETGGL